VADASAPLDAFDAAYAIFAASSTQTVAVSPSIQHSLAIVPQPRAVMENDGGSLRINQPFVVGNKQIQYYVNVGREEAQLLWRKLCGCHQVMN
jgi:hypothetical protein